MKTLDIDAIFEKNPSVDREVVKKHLADHGVLKLQPSAPAGSASPYGGRKMIVDDRPQMADRRAARYRGF